MCEITGTCYPSVMDRRRHRGEAERKMLLTIPPAVRDTRRAIGWTHAQLSVRTDISQSRISRFESGAIDCVSLAEAGRLLDVLRIRAELAVARPHVASGPWQRDAAHARCVAYAAGRLRAMGFDVRLEVEILDFRSRGWIDLVAFHRERRALLVAEVKTEIVDMGAAQRQLAWYSRSAGDAVRSFAWRVDVSASALLVLATDANENRLAENRSLAGEYPRPSQTPPRILTLP
jgi:hypothetical protein